MVRNNKGSSIVMAMVFIAVVLVVSSISVSLFERRLKFAKDANYAFSAYLVRLNVYKMLTNDRAWENTLNANISLDCVLKKTSCYSLINSKNEISVIKNVDNEEYIDLSNNNSGFNLSGAACDTFNVGSAATQDCVFKLNTYWQPECNNAICATPIVKIFVELSLSSTGVKPKIFNVRKYDVVVYK